LVTSTISSNANPFDSFTSPPPPAHDPFAVYDTPAQEAAPVSPTHDEKEVDFWASMGFGTPTPAAPAAAHTQSTTGNNHRLVAAGENHGLPAGGETYSARINTPQLGCIFFTARELERNLLQGTSTDVVDALGNRPLVAFTGVNTASFASGIGIGDVLVSVNGEVPADPRDASRLIRAAPRPVNLRFYSVPNLHVKRYEANCMVKYDTRTKEAGSSALDWKAKYVVVGGIIAEPWQMSMYRSRAEYDTAVMETQAGLPLSVKVKQWSLRNCTIHNDDKPPSLIHYQNKPCAWWYYVVLPEKGYPVKISCTSANEVNLVMSGIRAFLERQPRGVLTLDGTNHEINEHDYAHMLTGGYYGR